MADGEENEAFVTYDPDIDLVELDNVPRNAVYEEPQETSSVSTPPKKNEDNLGVPAPSKEHNEKSQHGIHLQLPKDTKSRPKSRTRIKPVREITPGSLGPKESKWDLSPYTYKSSSAEPSWVDRRMSARTPAGLDLEIFDIEDQPGLSYKTPDSGNTVKIVPPIGHFGDFYSPGEMGRSGYGTDSESEDEGAGSKYFAEDTSILEDNSTVYGQFREVIAPTAVSVTSKKDRKVLRNGLKLADRIGKVPLSKAWHLFSEIFAIAVFLTNVIVGIFDIVRGPQHLHYKVTAVVIGVLENIIMIILWFIARHPKFKARPDYNTHLKRMQFAENIIAECFMYITIIVTLFGFATEKMYNKPGDAFGWTQLILLVVDTLTIVYTNVVRMYMLYKLMKDIIAVVYPGDKKKGYMNGHASFAGYIMPRAQLTLVGNLCLVFIIGGMLGIQVWADNFTSEDYHATLNSTFQLILLVLIPLLGNILFALVNFYWITEVLISLSVAVGEDTECMKKLEDQYGEVVANTLDFAQKKAKSSQGTLLDVEGSKTWQKLLYGLTEPYILILIFFYTVCTFLALYFFDGFTSDWTDYFIKAVFLVFLLLSNAHLAMLMLLSIFAMLVFIISCVVYPLTVPCCCKKDGNVVDGYKKLRNRKPLSIK